MANSTEILIEVLQKSNAIINHIHCCAASNLPFSDISKKLTQKESYFFDCFEDNLDDILPAVDEATSSLRRCVFFLSHFEALCRSLRSCQDHVRSLLKRFEKSDDLILVTHSRLSWFHIQSNYFRTIISVPIQLTFASNDADTSFIAEKLAVSKEFVDFVVSIVSTHFKNPRLLYHIAKKVKMECQHQGIVATGGPAVAKICGDLVVGDAAFALRTTKTDGSATSQFPTLAKCALVAVYCASYNSPTTDQHFFFKQSVKQSSSLNREKFHETGPRPFDYQRALFIFTFFRNNCLDEHVKLHAIEKLNVDFNSQLAILLKTGIIQTLSAVGNIDEPRYRCVCPFSLAENVARSLKLQLKTYLADFAHEV